MVCLATRDARAALTTGVASRLRGLQFRVDAARSSFKQPVWATALTMRLQATAGSWLLIAPAASDPRRSACGDRYGMRSDIIVLHSQAGPSPLAVVFRREHGRLAPNPAAEVQKAGSSWGTHGSRVPHFGWKATTPVVYERLFCGMSLRAGSNLFNCSSFLAAPRVRLRGARPRKEKEAL